METGLRRRHQYAASLAFSSGILIVALFLQGCEPPSSTPGGGAPGRISNAPKPPASRPPVAPSSAAPSRNGPAPSSPNPEKADNPQSADKPAQPGNQILGDKLDLAGTTIELSSAIVTANTNLFLNRLPKPIVAAAENPEDAAPVADPFESIVLLGIIYNPKHPMALLSDGDAPTNLLKAGEMLSNGQIRVVKINRQEVLLEQVGVSKTQRTLPLPDIIGYQSGGETAGAEGSSRPRGNTHPMPAESSEQREGRFSNLNKLSDPSSKKDDGANVTLQEL